KPAIRFHSRFSQQLLKSQASLLPARPCRLQHPRQTSQFKSAAPVFPVPQESSSTARKTASPSPLPRRHVLCLLVLKPRCLRPCSARSVARMTSSFRTCLPVAVNLLPSSSVLLLPHRPTTTLPTPSTSPR